MNLLKIYQAAFIFTFLSSLFLGAFVYRKDSTSTVNKTWFLTSLGVSAWSICMFYYTTFPLSYDKALLGGKLTNISATFIPVFFSHFCLAFVGRKTLKNKILVLGYIFAVFILFAGFTRYFVPAVKPFREFYYYVTPGVLFYLHTIAFTFYTIYGEYTLIKGLKHCSPKKRNQIKYFLVSTSIAFLCGSTAFWGVYGINVSPLPLIFVSIYTITISYAIVKHNLLDINVAIRKGLIYSILISSLSIIYVIIALFLESIFRGIVGYKSVALTIFTITIFVLLFQPLKNHIQSIIDKYFFHGTIDQIDEENMKLREELQKSEKLKAVATLAAGMAHEIKNPLTSIKTFTEYIPEKKNDPAFLDKFYKIVRGEVDRINYIVQELLEFSKPSELHLKKADINNLLNETLELLNNDIIRKDIKIQKALSSLPKTSVDPSQIKQVFLNILLNAIDSMKNGGTLVISTGNKQNKISITVKDTGAGISKEDLKHIFDPFFSKKDGGTGLGLSVVHGIIEKHNGNIFVKSSLDKGTEFKITLPI